jgi:hypothetical protein
MSKSLYCFRMKDNQKVFVTNSNTNVDEYDGAGIKIFKEKAHRYFLYNSSFSKMRLMNMVLRKKVLNLNMHQKIDEDGQIGCIYWFVVDDNHGNVWFSYRNDHRVYVYSYVLRKLLTVIPVFPERYLKRGKLSQPTPN